MSGVALVVDADPARKNMNHRSTSVKSGYFGTTPRQRIIASSFSDESIFIQSSVPKQGGLSFRSALASICLTLSRVTPNNCPISSNVIMVCLRDAKS